MNISEQGKRKQLKNLIDKLKSGKILTNSERRQYDELSEEFDQTPKSESAINPLHFDRPTLCDFFAVTEKTISNWTSKGMPKIARGLFDVKECFKWWINHIYGGGNAQIDEHKTNYWREMAEGKLIENNNAKSLLIEKEQVIREWTLRATELRTGLRSWASRLPPILEGKDSIELRSVLRDAVDELLNNYCRIGRFTPETEEPTDKPKRGRPRKE